MESTSLTRISDNYITLSYCAGDPQRTKPILVNGIPFNAFSNLEHALERAEAQWSQSHSNQGSLLIWADQICINQSDVQERSEQVRMMREIYRRSSETYICLSESIEDDHLSWVPGILGKPCSTLSISQMLRDDLVTEVRHILLDFLVGTDGGGSLRASLSPRNSQETLQPRNSFNTLKSFQSTANSNRESTAGSPHNESYQYRAEMFQASLTAFIMNKWWRRSWVFQEFLSATSIQFLSGTASVSWLRLYPLVNFVCNDLFDFIERIREHFEAQVTVNMEQQYQAEKAAEQKRRKEEQQRRRAREQERKALKERKRRKEEKDRTTRQLEIEREARELEQRRKAETQKRELEESYTREKESYDSERLRQWQVAIQEQQRKRTKFDLEQRTIIRMEIECLYEQKSASGLRNPKKILKLRERIKELRHFQEGITKPMPEQIELAKRLSEGKISTKTADDLNRRCGGRLSESYRLSMLLSLDQVPEDPHDFQPKSIVPPVRRSYVSNPTVRSDTARTSMHSSMPYQPQEIPLQPSARLRSRAPSISATIETHGVPVDTKANEDDGQDLWSEKTQSDVEAPLNQQEMSLKRPEIQEIRQRDQIIHVQDKFRVLDTTAVASMAKAKAEFRRYADLSSLLQHSRSCAASDLRDRVYAFLGLSHPEHNIVPNYDTANTIEKVLIDTARSMILHDDSLKVLQHVHRGRDRLGIRLPSWVPDWTSKEVIRGIDKHDWSNEKPFGAGGLHANARFREDGMSAVLKVQATYIDKVEIMLRPQLDGVQTVSLSRGGWALCPQATRLDDEIWVLYGAARPAVLRRDGEDRFGYLGDALVCTGVVTIESPTFAELMHGQVADKTDDQLVTRDICVV